MADDAQSIRSLNWRELFPFLNLFRSFRIAIHPSKLVLGFALIFLVYCGGRALDWIWPKSQYPIAQEIQHYEMYRWTPGLSARAFEDGRTEKREGMNAAYAADLLDRKIVKDQAEAKEAAKVGEYSGRLVGSYVYDRNQAIKKADEDLDKRLKTIREAKMAEDERPKAVRAAYERRDAEIRKAHADLASAIENLDQISPHPIFDSFFEYEVQQFHGVVDNALSFNWMGGITAGSTAPNPDVAAPRGPAAPSTGVLRSITNFAMIGPGWLLRYHYIYFIIFAAWFLLIWAIFGGAIARIAGVHVARDEKISVRQALRFSTNKLLSFVFAPIIPLIIILLAGAAVAVGGLLMYIPAIGPLIVGSLFILALLAGFVMTLVLTGTVGGFNLMYPTIAVEGSDSFDAISRSFSYVFARAWRMIFYTVVALIYGALCFLFVRYFVVVMLGLTHFFLQWFLGGQPAVYLPEIWPPVNDANLAYHINFHALSWIDGVAAFLIAIWVYIVLTLLAAYVVSFYFSANTIIYVLMRKEVDATELDDVYVEDTEEDFGDVAATTPATTPAATTTPAVATTTPVVVPETPVIPPPAAPPA